MWLSSNSLLHGVDVTSAQLMWLKPFARSSENLIGFLWYILWLSHMISMSNANWKLHSGCSQRLERYKEITVHSNQSASDLSFSGSHWPGHVPRSLPPIIKANQTKKWRIWQFHCRNCSWEPPRRWNLSNKIQVLSCLLPSWLPYIYIYLYLNLYNLHIYIYMYRILIIYIYMQSIYIWSLTLQD